MTQIINQETNIIEFYREKNRNQSNYGLQKNITTQQDKSVLTRIKSYFERENMQAQYNVLSYRIILFCHGYKVAIKIDETGHSGHRNIDY